MVKHLVVPVAVALLATTALSGAGAAGTPLDTWDTSFESPAPFVVPETGDTVVIDSSVDVGATVANLATAAARRCTYTFTPRSRITRGGDDYVTESTSMTASYSCGAFAANVTIRDELPQGTDPRVAAKTLTGSTTIRPAAAQNVAYFVLGVPARPSTTVHFVYRLGRSSTNYTYCFDHSYTITLGGPPMDNGIEPMTREECNG